LLCLRAACLAATPLKLMSMGRGLVRATLGAPRRRASLTPDLDATRPRWIRLDQLVPAATMHVLKIN
jgi:hypothetical protein